MYEYKVVPAPKRVKRVKGVSGAEELFALTLTDAINEQARQGWDYVRAEHLVSEAPRGWLRALQTSEQAVLVFRRARATLEPRVDSGYAASGLPPEPEAPRYAPAAIERIAPERPRAPAQRLEPVVNWPGEDEPGGSPRLGPADRF